MNTLFLVPLMIGTTEIIALGALALLLFGGKKLPGLMKSMGQGVRQFKEGMTEVPQSFKEGMEDEPQKEPHIDGSENKTEISENPRINEDKQ